MPSPRPDVLSQLAREVVSCRACPRLNQWCEEAARSAPRRFQGQEYWQRPIPGFGDGRAWLWIVGLAPAAHGGNRTGRVFTGDSSGDFLFARLHEAGLASQAESTGRDDGMSLSGVFISPAVRCAPPENRPTPEEFRRCSPFLARELAILRPNLRVILPLGALAWSSSLKMLAEAGHEVASPAPSFAHGAEVFLPSPGSGHGLALVGSYHVSRQNTNTKRLTAPMFREILGRAKALRSFRNAPR